MSTTVDQPHLAYIAAEWRIRNKDLRGREREEKKNFPFQGRCEEKKSSRRILVFRARLFRRVICSSRQALREQIAWGGYVLVTGKKYPQTGIRKIYGKTSVHV